ncbi:MAG TPA: solute carrier family 23 protein [Syntrophobacteraceae bacterium]|nr:solute carrier family 23 protein [Syntrophobacteraceae bacterium]
MDKPQYVYGIDVPPPLRYVLLYGLQWAIVIFPALIIVATLGSRALRLPVDQEVHFFQLLLLLSGLFTVIQTLWGHRYPILDGPSTALLLTFIVLAPYGAEIIQGGTIAGGILLMALVFSGKLHRLLAYATPNVVGVILMLIAFSLLPHLMASVTGKDALQPNGSAGILALSFLLVLAMAAFSHWIEGFWKTLSLLLGMLLGTLLFFLLEPLDSSPLGAAPWVSLPSMRFLTPPRFYWPAVAAMAASYLAVVVNTLGSLHGVAAITDTERLPTAVTRGVFWNGAAGICCGTLGIVGLVSYSMSPGVILANRVASRYAVACGGILLVVAAFVPKLAAVLAMIPAPVVGAALCVAMGAQVGAAMGIVAEGDLSGRDYFVVGVPVLMGTLVSFLPSSLLESIPIHFRVFLGNGLVVGIFLVLFLEHFLLRKKRPREE